MSTDKILGERYRIGAMIGTGAFSVVYECTDMETHTHYAVKVLSKTRVKNADMEEAFEREAMALRSLTQCPYVTRAVEILQSTRNYYVVMDLANGGSLLQLIIKSNGGHGLPGHSVRRYFTQLMSGIRFMHACNIVHRDIKPENILLDSWQMVKISDFGFAAKARLTRQLKRQCGTPQYVAPEVLRGEGYIGQYADIWSCGVTLYVMLCGQLPFAAADTEKLFEQIQEGKYPPPRRPEGLPDVPPAALHLLKCCLAVNPAKRWPADRILKHPYLAGYDDAPGASLSELGTSWNPELEASDLLTGSSSDWVESRFAVQTHSCPCFSEIPRLGIDVYNHPLFKGVRTAKKPLRKLYESGDNIDSLSAATTSQCDESVDSRREGLEKRGTLRMLRQASCTDDVSPTAATSPHSRLSVHRRSDSRSLADPSPTPSRRPPSREQSRPTTTPHDPARFAVPVQRRFRVVHLWMFLQFVAVLAIVLVVAVLKIMFDIKIAKIPLPRAIRARVENMIDSAGFGEKPVPRNNGNPTTEEATAAKPKKQ